MADEEGKTPTREERIDELVRQMVELQEGVDPVRAREAATKLVDELSADRAPTETDLRRLLDEE